MFLGDWLFRRSRLLRRHLFLPNLLLFLRQPLQDIHHLSAAVGAAEETRRVRKRRLAAFRARRKTLRRELDLLPALVAAGFRVFLGGSAHNAENQNAKLKVQNDKSKFKVSILKVPETYSNRNRLIRYHRLSVHKRQPMDRRGTVLGES